VPAQTFLLRESGLAVGLDWVKPAANLQFKPQTLPEERG
jgi:hypothetical protein